MRRGKHRFLKNGSNIFGRGDWTGQIRLKGLGKFHIKISVLRWFDRVCAGPHVGETARRANHGGERQERPGKRGLRGRLSQQIASECARVGSYSPTHLRWGASPDEHSDTRVKPLNSRPAYRSKRSPGKRNDNRDLARSPRISLRSCGLFAQLAPSDLGSRVVIVNPPAA
jgi:hypothetical protein